VAPPHPDRRPAACDPTSPRFAGRDETVCESPSQCLGRLGDSIRGEPLTRIAGLRPAIRPLPASRGEVRPCQRTYLGVSAASVTRYAVVPLTRLAGLRPAIRPLPASRGEVRPCAIAPGRRPSEPEAGVAVRRGSRPSQPKARSPARVGRVSSGLSRFARRTQ